MSQINRTFRIFVSSTFKDMVTERNALQESVFPRLRDLCETHGTNFQAVDLRWGVSVQAQRDQQTMPLCIGEIKRCRDVSPRPHFIFLLGERYGWVPLPSYIPASEFERIRPMIQIDHDLVEKWYSRDDNAVPPIYKLRPRLIQGAEPGDPGWSDAEANEAELWAETEERLRVALSRAVIAAGLSGNALTRYSASATEQEIFAALFDPGAAPDAAGHVFGFIRASEEVDDAAIVSLKKQLQEKLPDDHLITYNPVEGDAESLAVFSEAVFTALRSVIESELQNLAEEDPLDSEIRTHFAFGSDRRRAFIGREKALSVINRYLTKDKATLLVVFGESGSGKTAFMAEARRRVSGRQINPVIMERFIGSTPASTEGRLLLLRLCAEIDRAYGNKLEELPETYTELAKAFRKRLELSSKERPLIIFIDALDQFARDDPALGLEWLPSDLPKHTRVVVSAIPSPVLDKLIDRISGKQLLEIGSLPVREAARLLDAWLGESNRTLQPHQKAIVLAGFKLCPRPLYLKLATEEAKKWVSSDRPDPLPREIGEMVSALFDRLACDSEHGAVMVKHSMGYLAAARNGLSEEEMLEILSLDEAVASDLRRRSPLSPRVNRVPPVVWSRLRADLDPYLVQRAADGTSLMGFYHRAVAEIAQAKYPGADSGRWHSALADYFTSKATVTNGVPHRRKLSELPYQLMNAKRREELETTLTDYRFLYYKNLVSGPQSIVDDCTIADRMGCGTAGINGVGEAMRLSSTVVAKHPEQLPGQITSRLSGHTNEVVAAFVESIPRIHNGPWLRPVITPMARSGGPLIRTLETGQGGVNDLAASCDGMMVVTAGNDGSIAIWDVTSGRELHRMAGHAQEARNIALSPNGEVAVSVSYSEIGIWDLKSGRRLQTIDMGRGWPGPAAILDERWALVGSVDSTISLIDMKAGKIMRRLKGHDKKIESIDACRDFAVSAVDRQMIVWDAGTLCRGTASLIGRSAIHTITAYQNQFTGNRMLAAMGNGGRTALTARASDDSSCLLWNLESGRLQSRISNTQGLWVSRLVGAKNRDRYVIGVLERGVGRSDTFGSSRLYILDNGRMAGSIEVGSLQGLAVSSDGMTAFTGGKTVSVWDLDAVVSGNTANGIPALSAVNISAVSGTIFGSGDGGCLVKINPVSGSMERVGEAAGSVVDVAVSDNESTVLAVLEEGQVEIWVDGTKQQTISVPGVRIQTVEITANGREAVGTGQKLGSVFGKEGRWRWDVATGDVINHLMEPSRCLAIARSTGQVTCVEGFGVTSGLKAIRLRDLPEGPAYAWVEALAVDGNGDRIAAATKYYRVQVWDTVTREQVAELALSDIKSGEHENTGGAMSLWLSSDGRWCLAASSDRTVKLWEVGAEDPIAVYTMDEVPTWVGATENGSIIVVKDKSGGLYTFETEGVSMDIDVKVRDAQSGDEQLYPDKHTDAVIAEKEDQKHQACAPEEDNKLTKADDLQKKGNELIDSGDYEAALDCFDRGLKLLPDNLSLLDKRASALLKLERYQEALSTIEYVLDKDLATERDLGYMYGAKGHALAGLGKEAAALDYYRRSLALVADVSKVWYMQGYLLQLAGDYEAALDSFKHAKGIEDNEETNIYIGYCYIGIKDYLRAEQEFRNMIERGLSNPLIYHGLGITLISLEDISEACQYLQRFINSAKDEHAHLVPQVRQILDYFS